MRAIVGTILAVDPGSEKCGLAVVEGEKMRVQEKMVVATHQFLEIAQKLCQTYGVSLILIGDRTKSKFFRAELLKIGLPIKMIDENNSSVEGRYRYLQENTTGWARLIPIGLRVPNQPYDDYVAVILAERFFKNGSH